MGRWSTGLSSDHPRSRGEHRLGWCVAAGCLGSSPLARGARAVVDDLDAVVGIIPARAGSTPRHGDGAAPKWDHPRSRGEHEVGYGGQVPARGSSPLARGAHRPGPARRQGQRIIPARAGSTGPSSSPPTTAADHPRSRGEHHIVGRQTADPLGSSPLARGARAVFGDRARGVRIIPARAGSTRSDPLTSAQSTDHPRSRGEHPTGPPTPVRHLGSSPLARGARAATHRRSAGRGIIPARAGSTTE